MDLKDYSGKNIEIDGLKKLAPVLGNYFPDGLYRKFVVNAGFMENLIYKGVQLFIHPVTKEKIQVMGTNKEKNVEVMKSVLRIEEIPVVFGGTLDFEI